MAKSSNIPFNADITKIAGNFQLPLVDVQQWIAISQKNIEALTAANQVAVEGMQALARRQAEIVKETIEGASNLVSEINAAGTPEDKLARQVELFKQTYEHTLANCKELAELAAKSNEEAAEVITCRVCDSLDEIKAVTKKAGKKAA